MSVEGDIFDWNNNPVFAGDTIVIVRTTPFLGPLRFGYIIDGKMYFLPDSGITQKKYCWDILEEHEIKMIGDKLYYSFMSQNTQWNLELSFIKMRQPTDIICIKGVSDNEEEYYKHYFSKL